MRERNHQSVRDQLKRIDFNANTHACLIDVIMQQSMPENLLWIVSCRSQVTSLLAIVTISKQCLFTSRPTPNLAATVTDRMMQMFSISDVSVVADVY